ncbi:hypothetical protein CRM22_009638 [Opisthorchis felineus]|uniref:Ion transport domain-containing protein n=1 Tax=Opisthorchis felineus TaxID=147828 RepID=A0A4S2L6L4_OPIFE|nr:hypothetical protein CRM22_009638 [Opisthorchis felineus]
MSGCWKCKRAGVKFDPLDVENTGEGTPVANDDVKPNKEEAPESCPEKNRITCKYLIQQLRSLVIDTSKSGYYYWLGVVSATVLYNAIVLPMRSAFTQFHEMCHILWMFIDYVIDLVYLADIFVGARTGYLDQGLLVRDVMELRKAYIKRRDFIWDILAIIPTDLLYLIPSLHHYAAWVRLNRLFKIYRFFEFVDRTETRTNRPNIFRISNLTMNIMVLIHLNACIYFGFSKATVLTLLKDENRRECNDTARITLDKSIFV